MNNKNTTYVASFQQHGERHFYKKGSFLFHEGSTEHHFNFIQEGLIKISTQTKKGNEKILTIAYPGEFVGLHGIIDRKSTRLNSSHVSITYAVFSLKKKT